MTDILDTLHFFVPGKPRGQQRPRFVRKLGIAFTPKESVNAMASVRHEFTAKYTGHVPVDYPVRLLVVAYFPMPKSRPKWFREHVWVHPTEYPQKPDWDNIGKLVADALNQVAWRDDALVVSACVEKFYCWQGQAEPGIGVKVFPIAEPQKPEKP